MDKLSVVFKVTNKKEVEKMAVSLHEVPVLRGKDAERFLAEKKKTEELSSKIAELVRLDPASAKPIRRPWEKK